MKAGVARVNITPDRPICMAGYSSRTAHSEGIYHDLFAKALFLQEGEEQALIITSDLIGFDRATCETIKEKLAARLALEPRQILLSASHTHTGPEIRIKGHKYVDAFDEEFATGLVERIVDVACEAASNPEPAHLAFSTVPCTLAVNRRLPTEDGVAMRPNPASVSDYEVAVVRVARPDDSPLAVLMSYACHPTTLGGYLIGADYPGYAQDLIEAEFEDCTALFIQGCGADQKPRHTDGKGFFKSGPHQVAQSIGEELGRAVLVALGGPATPMEGPLRCRLEEVSLPLQGTPTREEADQMTRNEDRFLASWGREMLRILDAGEDFMGARPFTIQTVSVGEFVLIGLSAEVCVTYAIRLKQMLRGRPCVVAAYTNGMIGYIPTAAMLEEGGYEATRSFYYDMMPAPYAPEVEELVYSKSLELLRMEG